MTRSTQTLLVILIALLAAALVIAVALLLQGTPPPPDNDRTPKPPAGKYYDPTEGTPPGKVLPVDANLKRTGTEG